jgi:hypothetical protein
MERKMNNPHRQETIMIAAVAGTIACVLHCFTEGCGCRVVLIIAQITSLAMSL